MMSFDAILATACRNTTTSTSTSTSTSTTSTTTTPGCLAGGWCVSIFSVKCWMSVETSNDGQDAIATCYGQPLFTTNNGGSSWTQRSNVGDDCAISGDGSRMYYSLYYDVGTRGIFYSTNEGVNWTPSAGTDTNQATSISAADATRVIGIEPFSGSSILVSTNDGVSFASVPVAGVGGTFHGTCIASDGMTGYVHLAGNAYKTINGGSSWSPVPAAAAFTGVGMACDASGSIVAIGNGKDLKLSTDGGASFTTKLNAAGQIQDVAMSDNGEIILVAAHDSPIYLSLDGGDTWEEEGVAADWQCCDLSEDGSVMYIGQCEGYLYSKSIVVTTTTSTTTTTTSTTSTTTTSTSTTTTTTSSTSSTTTGTTVSTTSTTTTTTTSTTTTSTTTTEACSCSSFSSDQVPSMTNNTNPSGVCSAQTNNTQAWFAFDGDGTTGGNIYLSTGGVTVGWLRYQFSSSKTIRQYTIYPPLPINAAPSSWLFQGSNDGTNWDTLDIRSGFSSGWVGGVGRSFEFCNSTAYLYYRINVTQNAGSVTNWGCALLQMFECLD